MSSKAESLVEYAIHFMGYNPDTIKIPKEVLIEGDNRGVRAEAAHLNFIAEFYTGKTGCSVETSELGAKGIIYVARDEFPVNVYVFNPFELGLKSSYNGPLMARSASSDRSLEPVIGLIAEDFFEQTIKGVTYCCCKVMELPENEQNMVIDVLKEKGIDLYSSESICELINS